MIGISLRLRVGFGVRPVVHSTLISDGALAVLYLNSRNVLSRNNNQAEESTGYGSFQEAFMPILDLARLSGRG